jgi:hypothetical protein
MYLGEIVFGSYIRGTRDEGQSHDRFALGRHLSYLSYLLVIKAGGFRGGYSPLLGRYTVTVYGSGIHAPDYNHGWSQQPNVELNLRAELEFDSESISHLLSRRDFSYDVPDRGKVATLT